MSFIFPFLAIYYGPKYLLAGKTVKGLIIVVVFAIEVYFIIQLNS